MAYKLTIGLTESDKENGYIVAEVETKGQARKIKEALKGQTVKAEMFTQKEVGL